MKENKTNKPEALSVEAFDRAVRDFRSMLPDVVQQAIVIYATEEIKDEVKKVCEARHCQSHLVPKAAWRGARTWAALYNGIFIVHRM